jgi:hypothetical protein
MWLTLSGVWSGSLGISLPASLAAAAVAYGGGYGIAVCCGLIVFSGARDPQITEDPAWFNLLQDQLLYCGLAIFGVGSALMAITRSPGHSWSQVFSSLLQVATYLAPFVLFFVFTIVNSWKHFARQPARIYELNHETGRPTEPIRWIRLLRRHMLLQAVVSVAIAVISIVGVMGSVIAAALGALLKHLQSNRV